jgi:hypothetical protein
MTILWLSTMFAGKRAAFDLTKDSVPSGWKEPCTQVATDQVKQPLCGCYALINTGEGNYSL